MGEPVAIVGTGMPGTPVDIIIGNNVVGTAVPDEQGNWQFDVSFETPGFQYIGCRTTDRLGNESYARLASYVAVAPRPTATTTSTPTATQTLPATATPEPSPTASHTPSPPEVEDPKLEVGESVLTGTGEPGSLLEVLLNGRRVSTTTVAADGRWQAPLVVESAGTYTVEVSQVNERGAVMAAASMIAVVPTPTATSTQEPLPSPTFTATATETPVRPSCIATSPQVQVGDLVQIVGTGKPGTLD